ncbi:tRNA (guanosine(37)-N1)-methyltransferase TrmD [Terriglobus sp.]|uniref:tRNA (guanosine(37)-N1)-methyltransferase TrmD n=1 Tax=Terriglobus sp. TaxID=1889013 RepID=UPI003B007361
MDDETAHSMRAALRFDILTIFPDFFTSVLRYGVVARALQTGIANVHITDLRDYTHDRHRTVDDRPFGGGEGMVLKPEPIFAAADALGVTPRPQRDTSRETVIMLSPQGQPFTQQIARTLALTDRVVLLCGRYEGVDQRVVDHLCDQQISIGDYVLSGGELASAAVLDATVRLLPGVLGNADSSHYESFGAASDGAAAHGEVPLAVSPAAGLLDYPHYTRPADFRGWSIPEVLAGGNHTEIRRWRRERALETTLRNRPDLLNACALSRQDRELLKKLEG